MLSVKLKELGEIIYYYYYSLKNLVCKCILIVIIKTPLWSDLLLQYILRYSLAAK